MLSGLAKGWNLARALVSRLAGRTSRDGDGIVRVQVHVEYDETDQAYIASCVDIPGCISYGQTVGEALENLVEAFTGVVNVQLQSRAREAVESAEARVSDRSSRDLALTF
jgi:predicted RNase H-like HicB family nuclease